MVHYDRGHHATVFAASSLVSIAPGPKAGLVQNLLPTSQADLSLWRIQFHFPEFAFKRAEVHPKHVQSWQLASQYPENWVGGKGRTEDFIFRPEASKRWDS